MRNSHRTLVAFLSASMFLCVAFSQETLTNQAVVDMVAAGLPDDVIIAKIRNSSPSFDLSTPALAKLTQAKVPSAVIKAMIEPKPSDPPPPVAVANVATDPNDPMAPHDPGIYLMTVNREGGRKMALIERAGSGMEKTANVLGHAFTYGIVKAKLKAELPGQRAAVRSSIAKPEFYMYFPPTGNLGAADTISSPSQFMLMSLEVKKDHRETTVLKLGFAAASSGMDEKRVFRFNADKMRPYVYKLVPDASLREGEYAFVASTGMGGTASSTPVVIFDFGVDLR